MAREGPESRLQREVVKYLKSVSGLFYFKVHGGTMQQPGIPDILVCYRGRFIGFELKAHNKRPTPLQAHTMARIVSCGGMALVVYNISDVQAVVERVELETHTFGTHGVARDLATLRRQRDEVIHGSEASDETQKAHTSATP